MKGRGRKGNGGRVGEERKKGRGMEVKNEGKETELDGREATK